MNGRRAFLFAAGGLLAGCGFQLRGEARLPFATLHVPLPANDELREQIRRAVEGGSTTRLVADAAGADARLFIIANKQNKNVLSVSAAGRVREFELVRRFTFRVVDREERERIVPSTIVVRRDITFSDEQVLSKEAEEVLLWQDMQKDLVQQLLRRLAAAKP